MKIAPIKAETVLIGVGVAVGIYLLYRTLNKAGEVAGDVVDAINPLNSENIFYSGVNNIGALLTGNDDFSLGAAVYDAEHAGYFDYFSPFGTLKLIADKTPDAVKPTSDQNMIYQGVNKVGEKLTGDKGFSLGGWIYDVTH